jgi:hypothetical protein
MFCFLFFQFCNFNFHLHYVQEFQRESKLSEDETAKIVAAKMAEEAPKPNGWYRVSATRNMTGGHRLIPKVNPAFNQVSGPF